MRRRLPSIVALLLFACRAQVALAVPIVTALHTLPPNASGWFHAGAGMATQPPRVFDNREAQSFTTLVGGVLDDVSCIATRIQPTTADLRVTIAALAGGQPGTVLGSRLVNAASIGLDPLVGRPDAFNVNVSFAGTNIMLSAATQYVLVFSTDTTEANYRLHGDRSGYAGGAQSFSQNGRPHEERSGDLFFQVRVTAVPEPATSAAAVAGLVCLGAWRRWRATAQKP